MLGVIREITMQSKTESLNDIKKLFIRRNYRPGTISLYTTALENLFDFYSNEHPSEISFIQITDFINYLRKRKKLSSSTIQVNLVAFDHFYNTLQHKDFDIQSLKPSKKPRKTPEILSPNEVKQLLQSTGLNTTHYVLISLIYSAGLELSQVKNLKIEDVDCERKQIKIRDSNNKIIRVAILADHLVKEIQVYKRSFPNKIWLFEGKEKGKQYSSSSIQKIFKKTLSLAKIKKKVTVKSLKYTYIKHVELYDTPLPIVLKEMDIFGAESYFTYSQIGLTDETVSFSPLDRILHEKNNISVNTTSLEKSFSLIQNEDEKSYLLESIKCFKAGAPRAAIILAWIAAIRNIQNNCLNQDRETLNEAIKKHNPKAPQITSLEDFEKIKERLILETSHTLKIYSKHEKDILVSCLGIRNKCGHPGAYMPEEHRVASFLEDLYNIVFSKKLPYTISKMTTIERISTYDDDLPF